LRTIFRNRHSKTQSKSSIGSSVPE
jgi:hypothetical protein